MHHDCGCRAGFRSAALQIPGAQRERNARGSMDPCLGASPEISVPFQVSLHVSQHPSLTRCLLFKAYLQVPEYYYRPELRREFWTKLCSLGQLSAVPSSVSSCQDIPAVCLDPEPDAKYVILQRASLKESGSKRSLADSGAGDAALDEGADTCGPMSREMFLTKPFATRRCFSMSEAQINAHVQEMSEDEVAHLINFYGSSQSDHPSGILSWGIPTI